MSPIHVVGCVCWDYFLFAHNSQPHTIFFFFSLYFLLLLSLLVLLLVRILIRTAVWIIMWRDLVMSCGGILSSTSRILMGHQQGLTASHHFVDVKW